MGIDEEVQVQVVNLNHFGAEFGLSVHVHWHKTRTQTDLVLMTKDKPCCQWPATAERGPAVVL